MPKVQMLGKGECLHQRRQGIRDPKRERLGAFIRGWSAIEVHPHSLIDRTLLIDIFFVIGVFINDGPLAPQSKYVHS
jgi:hypothetical protein